MEYSVQEEGGFKYIEAGEGKTILLLHGLFGALSNFKDLIDHFSMTHKVIIPLLPIYDRPIDQTSVGHLAEFVDEFLSFKKIESSVLVGNSLGGHVALIFAIEHLEKVTGLVLTGSSGLFENTMGNTFPKRGDYEFIRAKTASTFYDPETATKELVDEVFDIVNDRNKALCILAMAKSAIRQNLAERLEKIQKPALLIWGKNDEITPPFVAEEFDKLLPMSELHFIDKCGHAPMMEQPTQFNEIMSSFMKKIEQGFDS